MITDRHDTEALVLRVCAEFGIAETGVRDYAERLVDQFAGARIRAYVPLLVESQLREYARRLRTPRQ